MAKADRNKRTSGNRRTSAKAERARAKNLSGVPRSPAADLPDDDPRLAAAATEAAARFGEFEAAFRARRPGDTFAVKVPFADDYGRENVWVAVAGVSATHLTGRVDGHPAVVRAVGYRQRVRVPRAGLRDWLYVRGNDLVGGFTLKVAVE